MKVMLINPPQRELHNPTAYVPLGLCYLGAVLEEAGVDVEAVNLANTPIENIDIPHADYYGITCVSATYQRVIELSKKLKKYGKVVIGGVHPSIMPIQTWIETGCGYVITGEAEYAFKDLVLGNTDRLITHAGIITNLDNLPFPARGLFNKDEVIDYTGIHGQPKGEGATTILSSRGCPMNCQFCCKGHDMLSRFRFRSARNVREEIEQIMDDYGISHFRFIDDAFTANRRRVFRLCSDLKELDITWMCITRADWVNKDMLKAMREAGCVELDFGVESGSQRLLNIMNKRISVEQLTKAINLTKETGISAKVYLMCNYPGETEADIEATKRFMRETKPDKWTLSSFVPLVGSSIYNKENSQRWYYPDDKGNERYKELKKWLEGGDWRRSD